jgi:hypothetical protein
MSAAPSPAPAETPVTPLRPSLVLTPEEEQLVQKVSAREAAKARAAEGARRISVEAWIFGVAVPPLLALAGQGFSDGVLYALLIPCWALVLPTSGLSLAAFAAVRRTARDAATLMVAVLSLAASILLMDPAGIAGGAVVLDRHAGSLEAIARDLAGEPAAVRQQVAMGFTYSNSAEAVRKPAEAILERLHDAGFASASTGREYVAFQRRGSLGWNALYLEGRADRAALGSAMECEGLRMRPAGGDWYLYRCSLAGYD